MNTIYYEVSMVCRRILCRGGPGLTPGDICSEQSGIGTVFLPLPVLFRQCSTLAYIHGPINLAIGSVLREHASAGTLILFGHSGEGTICV